MTENNKNTEVEVMGDEEILGIWAMYTVTGRLPEGVSQEAIEAIGDTTPKLKNVTALFNGLINRERKLVEALIDDNAVKDIILQDKLGVTEEDYKEAEAKREQQLEDFADSVKAQLAQAQAEKAIEKDKELKGE